MEKTFLKSVKRTSIIFSQVPTFNKKEEIFSTLCEYAVPNVRATWFIKMTAAHNMGTQESRNRRKLAVDQSMGRFSFQEQASWKFKRLCSQADHDGRLNVRSKIFLT